MNITRLESLADLRLAAPQWNDLWRRSETTLPAARAELLATWCECFASGQPLGAVVVEEDGRFVAALPWVVQHRFGCRYALLPGNHWAAAGDLLLDARADARSVCRLLVAGLRQHAPGLFVCRALPAASRRWRQFIEALAEQGIALARRPRFSVDRVAIGDDWQAFFASRSQNHRHHMRRAASRARQAGPTELSFYDHVAPHDVERLLRGCLAIESSGWKGQAGNSVLQNEAASTFYLRQARQLAAWGEWRLAVLRHAGLPIAFEYGWLAKGVYATPKIGYDETFAPLSPGQLLRCRLFERFHQHQGRDEIEAVDFFGPSSDATRKWATDSYPVERLAIGLSGPLARWLVAGYRHLAPLGRTIRAGGPSRSIEPCESPAARPAAEAIDPPVVTA